MKRFFRCAAFGAVAVFLSDGLVLAEDIAPQAPQYGSVPQSVALSASNSPMQPPPLVNANDEFSIEKKTRFHLKVRL